MNANIFVTSIGASLDDFFRFCESENGVKAEELHHLFKKFFSDDKFAAKPVKKEVAGTSAGSGKATQESPKKASRKPSGKKPEAKGRDEQTPLMLADLNNAAWAKGKKLAELKTYTKERGLPVSGTKAQVIENLAKYEHEQGSSSDEDVQVEEEDLGIKIKQPKTRTHKLAVPLDKPVVEIEYKYDRHLVKCDDIFLVVDGDGKSGDVNVIGYITEEQYDDTNENDEDAIDIMELNKDIIQIAQKKGLECILPDNLD